MSINKIIIVLIVLALSCNLNAKDNLAIDIIDTEILNIISPVPKKPMESFSVLMDYSKKDPKVSYYSGVALQYFMNQASDSQKLYKQAIELYEEQNNTMDIVLPLHNMGMLLMEQNKTKDGLQYLQRASELGYDRATYNLAIYLSGEDDYYSNYLIKKRQIGLFQKLLSSKKYKPAALALLGRLYMDPPRGENNELIDYGLSLKYLLEALMSMRL